MTNSTTKRRRMTAWLAAASSAGIIVTSLAGSAYASPARVSAQSAPKPFFVYLSGPLDQPITVAFDKGMLAAAKDLGVKVQYGTTPNLANFVPDMSNLIKATIGRHPAGIAIGDFFPSAFDPLIKEAAAAGIPVVVDNTGLNTYLSDGAIGFVGEIPSVSGTNAGKALLSAGMLHVVCVNTSPQNPVPLQRCEAAESVIKASGGTMSVENIPLADVTNPSAIATDVEGYLSSHKNIDGVISVAAQAAPPCVTAVQKLGKTASIKVASFDVDLGVLQGIQAGTIQFTTDQQPFLQGYYPILMLSQFVKYGLRPTAPVDTGGFIVTKSNIANYFKVNKTYPGVIGA
jgi:simple sugar transport system substrate-binding protein